MSSCNDELYNMKPLLVVILGPTAVGKTELTLLLAERMKCPVLNCDSRQIYNGTVAAWSELEAQYWQMFGMGF